MEIEVMKPVKINVKSLLVEVPVYDFYDGEYDDLPKKVGEMWNFVIDIDSGTIIEWNHPEKYRVFLKVCDGGRYTLLDDLGKPVAEPIENYVPKCIPNEYGDYIDINILPHGIIVEWDCSNNDFSEFFEIDND